MFRTSYLCALILVAGSLLACSDSGPPDLPLERVLGLARGTLATDVISRRDPTSLGALGKGWSVDANAEKVVGFWALGKEAELHLYTAQEGEHRLEFEVMPPVGASAQGIVFHLNGERIPETLVLQPDWQRTGFALPANLMRVGYNHLVLSFSTPLRPTDVDLDSDDDRLLAARFRYLRLVPPAPRPMVPFGSVVYDEPGAASASASSTSASTPETPARETDLRWKPKHIELPDDGGTALEMPADSILELALRLPNGARWEGRPTFDLPAESEGALRWVAELLADDGTVTLLDAGGSDDGWLASKNLSADLSAWGGSEVSLRLRSWGSVQGSVRWAGLGVRALDEPVDTRQFDPPARPIPESTGRLGRPDVVMILLDAARADAFSTYRGFAATPAVDALAADGTRFERAYAPAAWTGQSIYSILTGRYPEAHGVVGWKDMLPTEIRSLFQNMYAAGYYTYLWTEHPVYRATRALRYDVDTIVDVRPRDRIRRRQLLPAPGDLFRDQKPTFAFVHLVPPHDPYVAPAPFGGSHSAWYQGDFSPAAANLQRFSVGLGKGPPSNDDVRYVLSLYQENVEYADSLVADIVATLKRSGRYDEAMIVLLADHGEAFYEHGHFLHTRPMYQELLHVPLVIKWPSSLNGYARAVEAPVSLIDLAPTVLDGIGVDSESFGYQGTSLLPLVLDGFVPVRDLYASTSGVSSSADQDAPLRPMATLFHDRWKVIYDEVSGRVELYDLSADPGEQRDLSHARPAKAQLMLQRLLLQQLANHVVMAGLEIKQIEGDLDPEVIERLRILGYIQ